MHSPQRPQHHANPTHLLLALLLSLALATLTAPAALAADAGVPPAPKDLIYVSEGSEISPPAMEDLIALLSGLNGAHEEKVGVLITDAPGDAQALAEQALTGWGLQKNGAVLVVTTRDEGVGLALSQHLESKIAPEDRADVVNKVHDGIGDYSDWAVGVQSGLTRLFIYIEGEGLAGGTDEHSHGDGHDHETAAAADAQDPGAAHPQGDADGPAGRDVALLVGGLLLVGVSGGALVWVLWRLARRAREGGGE